MNEPELYVLASAERAQAAGFKADRTHRDAPWIRAWWVDLGSEPLRGSQWCRVIITGGARERNGYALAEEAEHFAYAMSLLRAMNRVSPQVWMDL